MPPRKTRAAAAAAAASAEEAPGKGTNGVADADGKKREAGQLEEEDGPAAKRSRIDEEAAPQPPVPGNSEVPLPPEDEVPPPPPPTEDVPPPPDAEEPPPPPPPVEDLAPPPPPPEVTEEQRLQAEADQEKDDEEIGGADYWERIAREEQEAVEKKEKGKKGTTDLYLDTINRSLLDFDFEKLCSVSLSNINIYACLVCGKYYQGRGPNSFAYYHAINDGHRVFMNLESSDVYVLPDNYKVNDPSLSDIKYLLLPTYADQQIRQLDAPDLSPSLDLHAQPYLPGCVGLNNIGANDYMNVVIQALAHVRPLRNFFLRGGPPGSDGAGKTIAQSPAIQNTSELVRRFAALVRKIWNPRGFKAQVSPHEFLQEVVNASKGRFSITKQGDPVEFLGWLLNRLHTDMGGSRKKRSIISDCFQGEIRIESQKVFVRSGIELDDLDEEAKDKLDSDGRKEGGQEDELGNAKFNIDREVQVTRSPFFLLTIDLPTPPVFQDSIEKNIIPQVPIGQVLAKYDGISFQEARGQIKRFKCVKLPPFVVLHFRRFTKNNFVEERNPTIVNFPVKGLVMDDYVDDPAMKPLSATYDLVSNITHEAIAGTVREGSVWRSQVHTYSDGGRPSSSSKALQSTRDEEWFSIQDLLVEKIDRQLLFLGETYVQIWAKRPAPAAATSSWK